MLAVLTVALACDDKAADGVDAGADAGASDGASVAPSGATEGGASAEAGVDSGSEAGSSGRGGAGEGGSAGSDASSQSGDDAAVADTGTSPMSDAGDAGNADDAGDAGDAGDGWIEDLDRDGDGVPNAIDAFPDDPNESVDTDGDGQGNNADIDDDGDGANDDADADDADATRCSDVDGDACDDCSSARLDVLEDGADGDADGICDGGDAFPESATQCKDADADECDDCASAKYDPSLDGDDFDMDGRCDAGDRDDDDDGSADDDDQDDHDPNVCSDDDFDTCDDCGLGAYDPNNDGDDHEHDGQCDLGDYDDDADSTPDEEDNCPLLANLGQADQDADGIGDLCDDTPCVGDQCLPHCKAIFDKGRRNREHDIGRYVIDPDGSGGRDPIIAACNMNGAAGGGWTQVLHYLHYPENQRELRVIEDGLPSERFSLNIARTDDGDLWGHASNAMVAELEPAELYFEASMFDDARIISFTTDDPGCIAYFSSGVGNCHGVGNRFVETIEHSANLPDAADGGESDQGEYAMTELPFYRAGQNHWAIRAQGLRWEVDDYAPEGPEHITWHVIWVRQRALPDSCLGVLLGDPDAPDGVYRIDADGWDPLPPFDVYCDMTSDGGGFTKILQTADGPYSPTVAAAGDVTSTAGFAKLSDAQIEALAGRGAGALYRVQGNRSARRVYVESAGAFSDLAPGWGVFGGLAGPIAACEAEQLAACSFRDVPNPVTLDTLAWGVSGDDCDRYAADPGAQLVCANPSSPSQRCVNAGAECAADGYADHALVEDLSIWIRPSYRSCRDLQRRSSLPVPDGARAIDPDGPGGIAPFEVYCDMTADGGGWTLIGKTAAGDYTSLTDQQFIDLIANPNADVNPQLLRIHTAPAPGQIAFWDRAKTNALFVAGGRVVRVHMRDHQNTANNRVYYQQRTAPPPNWDLWLALRNGLSWSDAPSPDGLNVANFGKDFVLAGGPSYFFPDTNRVLHNGDGSFAFHGVTSLTASGGEPVTVTRYFGLLGDGHGNRNQQWLLTADPMQSTWKDNPTGQRCSIWLR